MLLVHFNLLDIDTSNVEDVETQDTDQARIERSLRQGTCDNISKEKSTIEPTQNSDNVPNNSEKPVMLQRWVDEDISNGPFICFDTTGNA